MRGLVKTAEFAIRNRLDIAVAKYPSLWRAKTK
jgi:hypothetical protein